MIASRTIEEIKDKVQIHEVISEYVNLSKSGGAYRGLCPFHTEKTPSFYVNESKGFFHCFGCGKSGDAIAFMMEHERLSYVEAIRHLASKYHVTIEEQHDGRAKEETDEEDQMMLINRSAARRYHQQLMTVMETDPAVQQFLQERKISTDTIIQFQIGLAPDEWRFLTPVIIEKGLYAPAEKLGLVKTKDGTNYDFFRNRIVTPVCDEGGTIVGFSARLLPNSKTNKADAGKYINSRVITDERGEERGIFHKSKILFGLNHAGAAIRKKGYAYLVEGNFDVITMHDRGITNTVAPCGTSLTIRQVKLLKRYCAHVVIMTDGDKAGHDAMMKDVNLFLQEDFKVEYCQLPDGEDPDSFARNFEPPKEGENIPLLPLAAELQQRTTDAVIYKADRLLDDAGSDVDRRAAAMEYIAEMLSCCGNAHKRDTYIKIISKKHKEKPTLLAKSVSELIADREEEKAVYLDEDDLPLPKHVDQKEFLRYGFYEEEEGGKAGYYFKGEGRSFLKKSNFVMKPLFHVRSMQEAKDLVEVSDGYGKHVIELSGKSLVSLEQFSGEIWQQCKALFFGSKQDLFRILDKMSRKFSDVHELKTLGWQPEGFFAFSNMIFNGELKQYDDYGVIEHENRKYFSPSISTIYTSFRSDDDEYENDRYLKYQPAPITFLQWSTMMNEVYAESDAGKIGIAFALAAAFRDIVFRVDNNFPHLSAYGQKGSGKSKFAESLQSFFLTDLQPFNLNHGTEFAFFSRLSRFRNCIVWFDEFDDNAIKEDRFQSIKGAYDGSGRERGKGGSKNKTEIARINSALCLTGQYLSTRDDNAALTRCIIIAFKPRTGDHAYTKDEILKYSALKEYERRGISGLLTDLFPHRKQVESHYSKLFSEVFAELRESIGNEKHVYNERVLRNYTALVTMVKLFSAAPAEVNHAIKFPFTYEEFFSIAKREVVKLSALINESDALANFWNTVLYLLETKAIEDGYHFKIKMAKEEELNGKMEHFAVMRQLIYIRLTTVHALYAEAYRRQHGRNGIDLQSLQLYIKSHRAFMGKNATSHFSRKVRLPDGSTTTEATKTSSFVFDYDLLGVDLRRGDIPDDSINQSNPDDRTEPVAKQGEIELGANGMDHGPDDLPF